MSERQKTHVPAALAITQVKLVDLEPDTLNALLCKHLLGWKSIAYSFRDDGSVQFNVYGLNADGEDENVPKLGTSIRHLPGMLEAVIARGYKPTLHFSGRHWHAWVRTDPPGKPDASAKTLELAVARAALDGCLGRDYAELPKSRTRAWKAEMREEIEKVKSNPPATAIRTRKGGAVSVHVDKLKEIQNHFVHGRKKEE